MNWLIHLLEIYGLWVVFIIMLLQSIGLPLPAYPFLLVAAALMQPTIYNAAFLILIGSAGTLIGDFVLFAAGRRYGTSVLGRLCKISISPDTCVSRTGNLFGRYGASVLTFVKFIPGLSTLAPVIAGAYAMPITIFSIFSSIAALIYLGLAVTLGVIFRNAIGNVVSTLQEYGRLGGLIVIVLLAFYLFLKWFQRYRLLKQFQMDRVTVEDLNALMVTEPHMIILDARPDDQRSIDGYIPGSVPIDENNLDHIVNLYSKHNEVVIYCSCPNEITAAKFAQKLRQAGFKRIRPLLGGLNEWAKSGNQIEFV